MTRRRRASAVAAVTAEGLREFRPGAAKGFGEGADRVEDVLGGRRAPAVRAREVREVARTVDGLFGCLLHSGPGLHRMPFRKAHQGRPVPSGEVAAAFVFDANPNIDPATVNTLATCEWGKEGEPLGLIGDSGTGKSHLPIALGTEAAKKGFRVRCTLAIKLVNELVEADDKQLTKAIARYGRVDLLCIDELGYM
ncbi:hypothetical protein GCM10010270_74710 [Streptomyces violaceus]|nr:hypothetical protein GCM10010270_74710 [Streptomyces janthinus]